MKKLELTIKWENENSFELKSKSDDDGDLTICHIDEDGCIATLWESIQNICMSYFKEKLTQIGNEMKS